MKRIIVLSVIIVLALTVSVAMAMEHGHGAKGDGCHYCGMKLKMFAHSAMDIKYDDGSSMHVCSIHCAAVDMALKIDKTPTSIMVGDHDSKKKINAEKAYWVIDDSNPGVMTSRAKWAFKTKAAAEDFIMSDCEGSGKIVTFEDAMRMAYEDMYSDTKMIRNKRKMMKKKGMKHGM